MSGRAAAAWNNSVRTTDYRLEGNWRCRVPTTIPGTSLKAWEPPRSALPAARAAETESENPLINDPFARVFIDAAGEGMWSSTRIPTCWPSVDLEPDVRARIQLMIDFMATRTAFFDEFFLGAADAGVRQVVILAAGLDARSWRLPWPDGTVVYELDQPKVLEFKSAPCASTARTRRHGWSTYRSTFARIGRKRCRRPGLTRPRPSRLVGRGVGALPAGAGPGPVVRAHPFAQRARAAGWRPTFPARVSPIPTWCGASVRTCSACGPRPPSWSTPRSPDFDDLWYPEERTPVDGWLRERGWDVTALSFPELMARDSRSIPQGAEDSMPPTTFVSAHRRAS